MTPESERLASLDAFRGFAVASMVLVNNPGDWGHVYGPLRHAEWHGWTFTDLVFPFFLFIAGVSLALSVARLQSGSSQAPARLGPFVRRALVIIGLGLFLNLYPLFDFSTVRIPGVLQRIGLCLLVAAPIVLWGGSRAIVAWTLGLFVLYTVPMLHVPVPDAAGHVGAGVLEPGRDFGAWVDRAVFGQHVWVRAKTWDPEGLVSTLPAVASMLLGALVGRTFTGGRAAGERTRLFLAAGVAALVAGLALDAVLIPINKNLWTPSYTVFMTGWSLLAFAVFHHLLDGSGPRVRGIARTLLLPLTQFGRNALFLFVLAGLLVRTLQYIKLTAPGGEVTLKAWLYAPLQALPIDPLNASLAWALLFTGLLFVVAWAMWRRRWFFTA